MKKSGHMKISEKYHAHQESESLRLSLQTVESSEVHQSTEKLTLAVLDNKLAEKEKLQDCNKRLANYIEDLQSLTKANQTLKTENQTLKQAYLEAKRNVSSEYKVGLEERSAEVQELTIKAEQLRLERNHYKFEYDKILEKYERERKDRKAIEKAVEDLREQVYIETTERVRFESKFQNLKKILQLERHVHTSDFEKYLKERQEMTTLNMSLVEEIDRYSELLRGLQIEESRTVIQTTTLEESGLPVKEKPSFDNSEDEEEKKSDLVEKLKQKVKNSAKETGKKVKDVAKESEKKVREAVDSGIFETMIAQVSMSENVEGEIVQVSMSENMEGESAKVSDEREEEDDDMTDELIFANLSKPTRSVSDISADSVSLKSVTLESPGKKKEKGFFKKLFGIEKKKPKTKTEERVDVSGRAGVESGHLGSEDEERLSKMSYSSGDVRKFPVNPSDSDSDSSNSSSSSDE